MHHPLRSTFLIHLIAIVANVLVMYFVFVQMSGTQDLNKTWKHEISTKIELAVLLNEVQQGFGYGGFIHNFKNYIIRKDEKYYINALHSYQKVKVLILKLSEHNLHPKEQLLLNNIEATLDEYLSSLELAYSRRNETLTVLELDELVKIDDSKASASLEELKNNIIPRLKAQEEKTFQKIQAFKEQTLTTGFGFFIFFVIVSAAATKYAQRSAKVGGELKGIFDAAPDGIISIDEFGNIVQSNKAAWELFGYDKEDFEDLKLEHLISPNFRNGHVKKRQDFVKFGRSKNVGSKENIFYGVNSKGKILPLGINVAKTSHGNKKGAVCIVKDMTDQLKLKEASEFDHLTKLYNRRHFDDVLDKELKRALRNQTALTLMLIDVDNFKALNDSKGHEVGDQALQIIADFLKVHSRSYDHVARWGGDEFTLLCPNLTKEHAFNRAEMLCRDFRKVSMPFENNLSLSIGLAYFDINVQTTEGFVKRADQAVYRAKKSGKNRVSL